VRALRSNIYPWVGGENHSFYVVGVALSGDTLNDFRRNQTQMNALSIVLGIVLMLFAIAIIIVILLQEGSQKNLGVVTGGADTFLSKNKARSVDAFLSRWTKVIAIGFFVLVIVTNILMYFVVK
jgi:preprotein translocase subunit SecG